MSGSYYPVYATRTISGQSWEYLISSPDCLINWFNSFGPDIESFPITTCKIEKHCLLFRTFVDMAVWLDRPELINQASIFRPLVTSGLLWPWKLGCLRYKVFLLWLIACPEKPWRVHLEKGILVLDEDFFSILPTHLVLVCFVCLSYLFFYSILCKSKRKMWHHLHYVISFLIVYILMFISGARL